MKLALWCWEIGAEALGRGAVSPSPPSSGRMRKPVPPPYQQSPAPLGGGLVKAEWFKRYRRSELPERFDRIVQSWDTANEATEFSDFSVCTTWGVKGKELFLLAVFRRKLEYPALKRAVREQQGLFEATVVLI